MAVESLEDRIAEMRAKFGTVRPEPEPEPEPKTFDADLVPDIEPVQRSEDDQELDRLLNDLSIADAYRRWCGKSNPQIGSRRESIKISCPNPEHPDHKPSAWMNLDKNVFYCDPCDYGGDVYDIAAWHFGFPVPGYKTGKTFHELREKMALDLGYVFKRSPGGKSYLAPVTAEVESQPECSDEPPSNVGASPSDDDAPASAPEETPSDPPTRTLPSLTAVREALEAAKKSDKPAEDPSRPELALVTPLPGAETDRDGFEYVSYPSIDWPCIADPNTFLESWMMATRVDDLPTEYYFWLGLMAVGLAVGRDVVLADNPEVRSNLFVCILGPSGVGKSRAIGNATRLLKEALPYDHDDPNSTGTYIAPMPGSAEALVDVFSKPVYDPADPKRIVTYGAVRGLVKFDELSSLIGRASRLGSVIKPMIMEFYDGYHDVEIKSRGLGLTRASGHYATVVTTTQPRSIRNLLLQEDADSGFVNRWIFACGPEPKRASYARASVELDAPIHKLRELRAWAASSTGVRHIEMEPDAFARWDQFFHDVLVPKTQDVNEDAGDLITRVDLHLKKCMLLLAINKRSTTITLEIVETTLLLWPYLLGSYRLLGGHIGFGQFEDCHQAVADAVRRLEIRGSMPGIRDIARSLARRHYPGDLLVKVIKTMVELGELDEEMHKPTRGPVVPKYHYVD